MSRALHLRSPAVLLGALLLAAGMACAGTQPLPVIAPAPAAPFQWAQGRQLMRHDSEHGVSFQAAFERDHGEYLEWWIRIDNRSQRTLQVSPSYFFYRVAETATGGDRVRALDPALAIAQLDASGARADAREAHAQHAGEHFLDFFVDHLLGFDPPSPRERRHHARQRRASYLAERGERERWRELLANRTVRRSTLRLGESVQGLVLFPRLAYPGRTELVLIVVPAVARFPYTGGR